MNKINKPLKLAMQKEASLKYPEEACGFVVNVNNKLICINCKNIDESPTERFVIGHEDVASAEDMGEIVAVWHSHPDNNSYMSETDIHSCNAFGVNWIVFGLKKENDKFVFEDILITEPSEDNASYLGRPYIYGVRDCFTLCCDYYKKEMNVSLTYRAAGYPESRSWVDAQEDILGKNFENCGFEEVGNQKLKVGDVFLIGVGSSVANHIAIYYREGIILHHLNMRLSCEDRYQGSYWERNTLKILRHRGIEDAS